MALPLLPGNSFNPNLGKTKYHKSHHFDQCNDVSMMVGESKPGIGGVGLPGQKPRTNNSAIPRGSGSSLPAWVAFDRQVLCFDAYFQEAVHEKREEQYRVRHCKVYFYLEDDSIQVIEPRNKNSGVPQGTLIRRHRIPRPPPNDDTFYTVEDFNVNNEISLYSKTFKITDCDEFTKNFLRKLGVRVNQPSTSPDDPYMQHRKAMDESMQPLRPYEKHDTLKQFLDHDRHVLRFYCRWDDTDSMFGDERAMVLHYFLADDTLEIREIIPPNAGRDATPMFLRRGKLPKMVDPLKQPGEITDRTVLNVFGPMGHGGRWILDSLKTGAVHQDFYTDRDLTIGTAISVWGRKYVLYDCDDFTREYYKTKYGIADMAPLKMPMSMVTKQARDPPPYNGFGSEEDSLCSCAGLLPKPPRRDFIKFMEKDRHGLDSNVLRFLARMDTTKPIDMDRRFIISYFLSDDTILVFEPPVRNSGIIGGKFLERGRVKKPDQPSFSTQLSQYYTAQDLHVGAGVTFNRHQFVLIDADEYAYNYLERHNKEFPVANVDAIKRKLLATGQDGLSRLESSAVSFEQFRSVLQGLGQGALTEHEIISLARYFQENKSDTVSMETLISVAQEYLRKADFEGLTHLAEQLVTFDRERQGILDAEAVRTACQAVKLPLPDDLLRTLLSRMPKDAEGRVEYGMLLSHLNWRENPAPPPPTSTSLDENWQGTPASRQIGKINIQALAQELAQIGRS